MRVGVTGASGHLGQTMLAHLAQAGIDFTPIGRDIPQDLRADVIFHLAAPNLKEPEACTSFTYFNEDLVMWAERNSAQVINTASWWQHAGIEAESLFYTRTKAAQQSMFAGHTTLTLFSVYGDPVRDDRGFIPQLIRHLTGFKALTAASNQPRDFIHANDVCTAYLTAISAPVGNYDIGTHLALSPMQLLAMFRNDIVPLHIDQPSATCHWPNQRLPHWFAQTSVITHIHNAYEETQCQ
jgi:nucleoside-diphosphate-sugar epimerase